MTLTSAVDDPRSVLRRFLAANLPHGADPARGRYREQIRHQSASWATVESRAVPGFAGLIGQALHLRLTLAFTADPTALHGPRTGVDVVADIAAQFTDRFPTQRAAARWNTLGELGHDLCTAIATEATHLQLADRTAPLARSRAAEDRLARMLLCAACFEVAYRNPHALTETPIARLTREPGRWTLRRLLQHMPAAAVQELIDLVAAAAAGPLADLRSTTRRASADVTFTGSADIGNAEADLVADHTLVEIKTTTRPERFPSTMLWQLLGYALLDYDDTHQIRDVAIYSARVPALVHWNLDTLLRDLGATTDLATLRRRLRRLARAVRLDEPLPDQHEPIAATLRLTEAAPTPPPGCWICHGPLPPQRPGGRRRYCSPGCRRTAARARRVTATPPVPIVLSPPPRA